MASGKLNALFITKAVGPKCYPDGDGLYLQVTAEGSRSWLFRYQLGGKPRWMGLGPIALVSLAEAREKAREQRKLLLDRIDPIKHRDAVLAAQRLKEARAITFKQAADQCIADRRANWRNAKHAAQWDSSLATYAYPVLGAVPVGDVDKAMVIRVLRPIWNTKRETADRVRSRIETVLNWATVNGSREGENPARWKGHLEYTFAERAKTRAKHHAAMNYRDVPVFMAELRERDSISARALEFTILTAARTNETIGAVDVEIDGNVWTIPAGRMKAEKEHKVPLCERALEIIAKRMRVKNNAHLFPSARATKALSNMAMLELLRGMRPGFTVHGFRSTFRDWAAESTNFQNHVVEAALAHAIPSAVEAAYRRGDLFEKRRDLMEQWGAYCARSAASVNVVRMHTAAA